MEKPLSLAARILMEMRSTIADSINPKKLTAYDDYVAVICCGVKAHSHTFHPFIRILYYYTVSAAYNQFCDIYKSALIYLELLQQQGV